MPWPDVQLLEATLPSAVENVALDEALLIEAEDRGGPAILRIWELDHPAIVLGASCRMAEDLDLAACQQDKVEIARRSSGGGTVVIGRGALNFSVILPTDASPELNGVESAQRYVIGRTLESIRRTGIDAAMEGSGDLTLGHRKFSGSAQRRLRNHVLVHASLLYDFPLHLIDRYLRLPPRRPAYRLDRSHSDFVTNLPIERARLVSSLRETWLSATGPVIMGVIPLVSLNALIETKFSENRWIERL